jgi:hypothetical protein
MANKTHGSLAAEAAAYLRECAGAVEGFNGIQEEIRRQADCLVEWARKRGVLLTDDCTDGLERYEPETIEHVVYLRRSDRRVIKCTKAGKFGYGHGPKGKYGTHPDATPLFYLERLELMNQEFPTDLRLEGIGLGKPGSGQSGELRPYMVTSQRLIEPADKNHPNPSEEDIHRAMVKLGFELLPHSCYNWFRLRDGIIVTDTKKFNFILSDEGILPIDLIISRPAAI